MKKAILLKDLPSCPKGRIFKFNGEFWFLSATDEEWLTKNFQFYKLDNETVINNPDWFLIERKETIGQILTIGGITQTPARRWIFEPLEDITTYEFIIAISLQKNLFVDLEQHSDWQRVKRHFREVKQ